MDLTVQLGNQPDAGEHSPLWVCSPGGVPLLTLTAGPSGTAGKTDVHKHGFFWKRRTATSEVRNRIYILWHSQMLWSK